MKSAAWVIATLALILGAHGLADAIDRATEAQLAQVEAMHECWPAPGETTVIVSDGIRARCRSYRSTSLHAGMAPKLTSVAVAELRP